RQTQSVKPTDPLVVTAFVDSGTVDKNEGRLPTGPAPFQALVSLDKDKVVVRTNQPVYVPKTVVDGLGRNLTFYETIYTLRADRYHREDVHVRDTHGRKLDNKELVK